MKYRRREPGIGVSSSRSNISRAMRGLIPNVPNLLGLRIQRQEENAASKRKLTILPQSASSSVPAISTTKAKRSSDRNRRSPSYYSFVNSSSDSTIAAPPKRPRQAGDVENFQPHLHRLSKLYKILPSNSLKKPTFLQLSEKSRHLPRKLSQFWNRILRRW